MDVRRKRKVAGGKCTRKKYKNLVEVGTSCPLLLRRGGVTEKLRAR